MGDGSKWGLEFRGSRIVAAMLGHLTAHNGLGEGHTVVFGGGSAGGRGAMTHLDFVASSLPSAGIKHVLGFLDSPYYVETAPYPPADFVGFEEQMKLAYENFNNVGVVSDACGRAYPEAPWKCTFGQFRMPFLTAPYLMAASQFDGWQISNEVLGYNGLAKDPKFDAPELAYVDALGERTAALVSALPSKANAKKSSVYSIACYSHHVSEKAGFYDEVTTRNVSQASALFWFLQESITTPLKYVDSCDPYGFDCGGFPANHCA